MTLNNWGGGIVLALFAAAGFAVGGCGQQEKKAENKANKESHAQNRSAADGGIEADDHSDWWCLDHGIPEEECSICDTKFAAECQKKGDWCEEHDRAKSQCFKCNPKLKDKFAAKYRAKYGKEPPPIKEEEQAKKDKEKKS